MSELEIDDLPDAEDRDAVTMFARSFNGYDFYGSFTACADAAKERNRSTLAELRNELFFSYRAINHLGDGDIRETYKELLPHFERLLQS